MTRPRPYHHGNLRAALLDAAERSIDEGGVEQLSLRELARTVGVSHGAPRTHFSDRQALLDALVERGFAQLSKELHAAHGQSEPLFEAQLRATMGAYVAFASRNPALLELMFAAKPRGAANGQQTAAADALSVVPRLIEEAIAGGELAPTDQSRYVLVLAAMIRGIVGLVTSNSINPDAVDQLITDAAATFIRGNAPQRLR